MYIMKVQTTPKQMTKIKALKQFNEIWKNSKYKKTDVIAKRTMWNDYTDALCKDGIITTNQYINWHQPF